VVGGDRDYPVVGAAWQGGRSAIEVVGSRRVVGRVGSGGVTSRLVSVGSGFLSGSGGRQIWWAGRGWCRRRP
jgi:hypothetical protein